MRAEENAEQPSKRLTKSERIITAGHERSDTTLITTCLEQHKDMITKAEEKKIEKMAIKECWMIEERGGLDTRNNDHDDFIDMAVWTIKDLMIKAYELGKAEGSKKNDDT